MKRNLVGKILGKIKIFVQDFVPIRTALMPSEKAFSNKTFSNKFSGSPILLENLDFLTGWGYQKILLEKDFDSYWMTVSQR